MRQAGIQFSFTIRQSDFILETSARLQDILFGTKPPVFEAAIVNPPYQKIGTETLERRSLQQIGIETSNLYAGFIALIQRVLAPAGQLVAITPRSFCNGPYFHRFREDLLANLELTGCMSLIHAEPHFRKDSVLQENIIFHAVKGP